MGTRAEAVKETTVFLSHFEDLPDYRQKAKVAYPLGTRAQRPLRLNSRWTSRKRSDQNAPTVGSQSIAT